MPVAGRPVRTLHLVGSPDNEFNAELSRLYATGCLNALAGHQGYETRVAYVSPDESWRFTTGLGPEALAEAPPLSMAEAMAHIPTLGIDVVVPQMFCRPGMTSYRALFDDLGIPYLGNRPAVMAAAADKVTARGIVAGAGVAVPDGEVLAFDTSPSLPFPLVVKPIDADNSAGVSLVRNRGEYDGALSSALAHSSKALVESYIELGREVRCGIIVRDGEMVCLPLEEYAVDPTGTPIRTADDKLARTDDGVLRLVAKDDSRAWIVVDDQALTERVWALARRCHRALNCRHYSLFDFRIDPSGQPWFLEAGLYCSYSPQSVIAVMAAAIGIDVRALFDIGVSEALREGQPCLTS